MGNKPILNRNFYCFLSNQIPDGRLFHQNEGNFFTNKLAPVKVSANFNFVVFQTEFFFNQILVTNSQKQVILCLEHFGPEHFNP